MQGRVIKSGDRLWAGAIALAVLVLYVLTLSPGVEGGDPGEFQTVPYVLGIPHQTGYPLYVLLGKLWTFLPLGSVAYRMNLLSAVLATATASLVFLTLCALRARPVSAAIGSLAFTLSPLAWFWSTMAGVRSMAVFFFALLIWLGLEWRSRVVGQHSRHQLWLYGMALGLGLALTHHRTIILAIPALALLIILTQPQLLRHPQLLARLVLLSLAPLSLYGYLWIRGLMNPPLEVFPVRDAATFLNLVMAPGAFQNILIPPPSQLPVLVDQFVRGLASQFALIGIILALIGMWALLRKLLEFAFLLTIFGLTVAFAFIYGGYGRAPLQGELISYLLPTYLVFAIWIGLGADFLTGILSQLHQRRLIRYFGGSLLVAAIAFMLVQQGNAGYQGIQEARGAPLDIWRQALRGERASRMAVASLKLAAPHAVILSDWEQYTTLRYFQLVEGWRPDLSIHYPVDPWQEWLEYAVREGLPLYLTRHVPEIFGQRFLTNEGPLVRLQTLPARSLPADIIPTSINFDGKIELVGYTYLLEGELSTVPRLRAGGVLPVTLYWRAEEPTGENYSVSVRLVDESGTQVSSSDTAHPVLSLYPTNLWEPGETIGDYYELLLPAGSPDGRYHLEVLVYVNEGEGRFRNLTIVGTDPPQERALLDPFPVY